MKKIVGTREQIQKGLSQNDSIDFRLFAKPRQHPSTVLWYKKMKQAVVKGQNPALWIETWDAIKSDLLAKKSEYALVNSRDRFRLFAEKVSSLPAEELALVTWMLYELSRVNEDFDIATLPNGQDFLNSFNAEKK